METNDQITEGIEAAVIGFVDGDPKNGIVYNIDTIIKLFIDTGYSKSEALELFDKKIKNVDQSSVFVWPN